MVLNNQVRIIGGIWRGRKIHFPDQPGLRPTPDRIRETVFNWLQPFLRGAHCLDSFAGSGVLGLEALSRGAEALTCLDASIEAIASIRVHINALKATCQTVVTRCPEGFSQLKNQYEVVFLDPPYREGLIMPCLEQLIGLNLLTPQAVIYLESELSLPWVFPGPLRILKQKSTKTLQYGLLEMTT